MTMSTGASSVVRSRRARLMAALQSTLWLALVAVAPTAWAKPIRPAELHAYDANGKKIGRVLDVNGPNEATVGVRVNGTTTLLTVHRDVLWTAPSLAFQSTDCTGTPYIRAASNSLLDSVTATGDPGLTVYVQQPGQPVQAITVGSETINLQPTECQMHSQTIQAFPAVPLIDLNTLFTPPFSIR